MLHRSQHLSPGGCRLALSRLDGGAGQRPLLFLPGFGMNSRLFTLGGARSFVERARASGWDPWLLDWPAGGARPPSLEERAWEGLPHALELIQERSGEGPISIVGCSLGGVIAYAMLAKHPQIELASLVTIGSPLSWLQRHPVVRVFSQLGPLLGRLPVRGSRQAAAGLLPLAGRHCPSLISLYLTSSRVPWEDLQSLVQTVEDPERSLSRELAAWIRRRELCLSGLEVRPALAAARCPLLIVTGSHDGIAPPPNCLSAQEVWGGPVDTLALGGPGDPWAHADLFIARPAPERVFRPVLEWMCA